WSRIRIRAFEDFAGAAVAHVVFENGLPGPMEKLIAEIGEPKVRTGEGRHEFVGLKQLPRQIARCGKKILIRASGRVDDRQSGDRRRRGRGFVDLEPIGTSYYRDNFERDFTLIVLGIANFYQPGIRGVLFGLLSKHFPDESLRFSCSLGGT